MISPLMFGNTMEYRVLGNLEIDSPRPFRMPGGRVRTLLVFLLLEHDRLVTIERLIDALWEVNPPATATRQVQHCVSIVRKNLDQAGSSTQILTEKHGYRLVLASNDTLDVQIWETLVSRARSLSKNNPAEATRLWTKALKLWRGPAGVGSSAIQRLGRAEHLNQQHVTVTEEYLSALVTLGHYDTAIEELHRFNAHHPMRERTIMLLITAQQALGRRIEALDTYRQFASQLSHELGLDPSQDLQQLHKDILDGHAPTTNPPATPIHVPAELPPALRNYMGRETAIRQLHSLTNAATRVATIEGLPGIGKTSLAITVAHQLSPHFPDGQLWVNLKSHNQSHPPLTPKAALQQLLRSLDGTTTHPDIDTDELAGMFRSRIHGRRLLIVLDDAHDASQIAPLLPGHQESLVIITSRTALTGLKRHVDATTIVLPPLSANDSLHLLRNNTTAPHNTPDLQRIAALCGGHPDALHTIAQHLSSHPDITPADIIENLTAPSLAWFSTIDDAQLVGSFDTTIAKLPPGLTEFLHLIAQSELETLTVDNCAALTQLSRQKAQQHITALTSWHFIDDGKLHPLLRKHLTTKTHRHKKHHVAARALLTWYSDHLQSAYRLLNPEHPPLGSVKPAVFADQSSAHHWIRDEGNNIVRYLTYAAKHVPKVHWKLVIGMAPWWSTHATSDTWIYHLSQALVTAKRVRTIEGQWRVHNDLGHAHAAQGRHLLARSHLISALNLASAAKYSIDTAWTRAKLIEIDIAQRRFTDANDLLTKTLDLVADGRQRPKLDAALQELRGILKYHTETPPPRHTTSSPRSLPSASFTPPRNHRDIPGRFNWLLDGVERIDTSELRRPATTLDTSTKKPPHMRVAAND